MVVTHLRFTHSGKLPGVAGILTTFFFPIVLGARFFFLAALLCLFLGDSSEHSPRGAGGILPPPSPTTTPRAPGIGHRLLKLQDQNHKLYHKVLATLRLPFVSPHRRLELPLTLQLVWSTRKKRWLVWHFCAKKRTCRFCQTVLLRAECRKRLITRGRPSPGYR